MHMSVWQAICTYCICSQTCMQVNLVKICRRWIMWEYANTHTHMGQTCKWDWEEDSPLAREPPSISPLLPHTLLTHVTHNQPSTPVQHVHVHAHTHKHYYLWLSHTSVYTLRQGGCPCLTPGPHWSLVWRPVCVCLASNRPFKCRIFTADRAILGDSVHRGPWICFGSIMLEEVSLLSSHSATLTGNELAAIK